MNLETAKLVASLTTRQIYRESKPFHVRGIATDISYPHDVTAQDWLICRPARSTPPKWSGMIRGFYLLSESWYAEANRLPGRIDSLMIGFYRETGDGGSAGEFEIEWTELTGKPVPRLQVYDDGWYALSHFRDLLDVMAELDNQNISPQNLCKILITLGMKDLTPREVPMRASR